MPPTFVVSDTHCGDGGPRDNFAAMSSGRRAQEFEMFLDYVEIENGNLIILGDLLDLWQSNLSSVLNERKTLLDRLVRMRALYIHGNHDIDLKYIKKHGSVFTDHPIFDPVACRQLYCNFGDKKFIMVHGHEQDPYCVGDGPGIGRISAIYSGIKEDKNGGPLSKSKFSSKTVEQQALGHWDRFSGFCRRLAGKPTNLSIIYKNIVDTLTSSNSDALLFGHTHSGGRFITKQGELLPIYNTGTWAEEINTFAVIKESGDINLFNWDMGKVTLNETQLVV